MTQRFTASPERVFDSWLDSEMIGQWMFGPNLRDEEVVRISLDPRLGGSFSFVVRRGGQEINHVGTYREMDRPRRLAFTWGVDEDAGDSSLVVVELAPLDAGCELTLTHEMDPRWADYAARTEAGWRKMLDALAVVLGS